MPDFWNRHIIIVSLKFIGSFEAVAFSFTNLFFRLATLVFFLAVVPFVPLPILLQQLQEKNKQRKKDILSALSAIRNTTLIEDKARKFYQEEVNFPSADWLSYLRTQLTVFVDGVCLRRMQFFSSAVFSKQFFHSKEAL